MGRAADHFFDFMHDIFGFGFIGRRVVNFESRLTGELRPDIERQALRAKNDGKNYSESESITAAKMTRCTAVAIATR